jgi:hypothetical protein
MAQFRNGVPDSVVTYNTPVTYESLENNNSVFVQDQWRVSGKLTLNWGGRLQSTYGLLPAACQVETPFIAAQCYDEVRPPSFLTFNPRVAVIYDVFGDGNTAIKVGANRYDIGLGNPYVERVSPVQMASDTRTWTDRNNDRVPQLDELGPANGFPTGSSNRYVEDLKRPYSLEFSTEFEQQVPGAVKLSVGYFHRRNRQDIGLRNLAMPTSSYRPLTVTEVLTGQQVTVYDQDPALRGRFDRVWDNYPELGSNFHGVDFNATKRFSSRWSLLGGVSYGRNTGYVFGTSDLNDPNLQFPYGLLSTDVPWQAKASGQYEMPFDIRLSGNITYRQGFPERTTVRVASDTVRLTQTSQVLDVAPRGDTRLPSVTMIDLSLRRNFQFGRTSIRPVVDVLNLANVNTVTNRITQLGPTYGRVGGLVPGRMIRIGFNIDY